MSGLFLSLRESEYQLPAWDAFLILDDIVEKMVAAGAFCDRGVGSWVQVSNFSKSYSGRRRKNTERERQRESWNCVFPIKKYSEIRHFWREKNFAEISHFVHSLISCSSSLSCVAWSCCCSPPFLGGLLYLSSAHRCTNSPPPPCAPSNKVSIYSIVGC